MTSVLVVEDDEDITAALRAILARHGYDVLTAADGRAGLRLLHSARPDLVVLDIGLPVMDGWEVLSRVREVSDVPVLMLTARNEEMDKVRGLRGGADDYLTKPFGREELVARIEALLRRAGPATVAPDETYVDARVLVDPARWSVRVGDADEDVTLTPTEFRLLLSLTRHAGQVLSPVQLLELAWDDPSGIGPDRVKFAVMRLRRALGWEGRDSPIEAVRGVGYRYRPAVG